VAESETSDLVVIGAGPGGYAAAFLAADKGMRVTLIGGEDKPGGTCLHVGCIPSKALLHAARLITDTREGPAWGLHFEPPRIDVATLHKHERKIVDTLSTNLLELCKRRKVEYLKARAGFEDPTTLRLDSGGRRRFGKCIIATGSVPTRVPGLSLETPRVMDSTGALALDELPASLLIVGGGYIGLELGTVYAALGSRVTVVELTDGLLPGVDRDLVRPLQARITPLFEKVYLSTKVARLEQRPNGIRAALEGAEVADAQPTFDRVLIAVGRKPNSRGLDLEKANVRADDKGFIRVDEQRRTSNANVYAIGDVAGEPMLAHKATHEGKIAVEAILGEPAVYEPRAVPAVVFTDPEIAWCGLTETEAKRANREVKVARFPWGASGRALTLGRTDGLTKLVLDPQDDRVIGVGMVGAGAGELIAEGVLAVEMAATARDLAMIIHPHPTLTETVGEAAESLYGTATHLMRKARA
jgi:dihydrolipoamide dehydrogenase